MLQALRLTKAYLTMKPINLLFFWQGPDHCYKAYLKERARKNLPDEYQQHEN